MANAFFGFDPKNPDQNPQVEISKEKFDLIGSLSHSEKAEPKGDAKKLTPQEILQKIKEKTFTTDSDTAIGTATEVKEAETTEVKPVNLVEKEVIEELPDASFLITVFDVVISNVIFLVLKYGFGNKSVKADDLALSAQQLTKLTKAFNPLYEKYKTKFSIEIVFILALVSAYGGKTLFAIAQSKEKESARKSIAEAKEKTAEAKPKRVSRKKVVEKLKENVG